MPPSSHLATNPLSKRGTCVDRLIYSRLLLGLSRAESSSRTGVDASCLAGGECGRTQPLPRSIAPLQTLMDGEEAWEARRKYQDDQTLRAKPSTQMIFDASSAVGAEEPQEEAKAACLTHLLTHTTQAPQPVRGCGACVYPWMLHADPASEIRQGVFSRGQKSRTGSPARL